jgi:2-methylaconitate cis-trans-isomerase PrpF
MEFGIEIDCVNGHIFLNKAAVARTSRRLMEGYAFVPSNIYGGKVYDEHLSVGRLE